QGGSGEFMKVSYCQCCLCLFAHFTPTECCFKYVQKAIQHVRSFYETSRDCSLPAVVRETQQLPPSHPAWERVAGGGLWEESRSVGGKKLGFGAFC
uniref:Chemokine interleukin-8-like domain-containing protein n=1 Tax=Calidris pygmaea TaxID=425635 RepID=A0A8C3KPR9_9CHAR